MSDPKTYEEAIAQGYKPIDDMDAFLLERGVTLQAFNKRKHDFATANGFSCATAPPGAQCLDWTDDQGVNTKCFCTAAKACGNCVQKKV